MSAPSVLFVGLATSIAGSTRSLATLMEALAGHVWRVAAVPPGPLLQRLVTEGICDEHVELDRSQPRAAEARKLARWAATHRRDLLAVHANGLTGVNLAWGAARIGGVPLVVWSHNSDVTDRTLRTKRLWRVGTTRFAAVSDVARELLVDRRVAPLERIELVPNPIGPDVVADERIPAAGRVRVLYLGGTRRSKGFHVLPGIVAAAPSLTWTVVATQASPDPGLSAVLDQLRQVGGDRVAVIPPTPDVARLYAAADLVVVPSMRESFSRVAAEAMANGLPVVASELPALRALVGDAGRLFPPGDAAAAAALVEELSADEQQRVVLGQRGRDRVAEYSPESVAARFLRLYGLE